MNTDGSVKDVTFVAFDCETTGLVAPQDRIVELGAVKFRGGRVLAEFGELVNPGRDIPAAATDVSGINNEMVQGKPSIAEVLPRFLAFIDSAVLLAHNADFDMGFLRAAAHAVGLDSPGNLIIDTIKLAKKAYPGLPSYSLQPLVEKLRLPANTAHRALDDAIQCMKVFQICADTLSFMGDISLKEVM